MLSAATRSSRKDYRGTLLNPPNVEQPQVQYTTSNLQDAIVTANKNLSDAETRELEELPSTETFLL
jgi:hypothetical protein